MAEGRPVEEPSGCASGLWDAMPGFHVVGVNTVYDSVELMLLRQSCRTPICS